MDEPTENREAIKIRESSPLLVDSVNDNVKSPSSSPTVITSNELGLGSSSSSSSGYTFASNENSILTSISSKDDSDLDQDYKGFEVDDDPDLPDAASVAESDNNDIVYEHTLKHHSFFETAKKRRHRHLRNRMRGTIPALHFTGTKKTEFWKSYGVEPNRVVEQGNIKGVDTILTEDEFKKLGPTERRIHIHGQKFKIVSNQEPQDSLYRAISQALGLFEDKCEQVRDVIFDELKEKWNLFSHDVCLYGDKSLPMLNPSLCSPKLMLRRYKDILTDSQSAIPEFELRAAALHYGFTYAIVEITSSQQSVTVTNCQDENILKKGTVKYYFLKSGGSSGVYEFLLPIGPLKKIQDGQYPAALRDVIIVEQYRPWRTDLDEPVHRPPLGPIPVGFALDHRVFLHRATVSHDLWSLLAEVMFRKLSHAPQIKTRIMDSKHNFALYYFACKAKKRYQIYGNASIEKLADDFSRRFSRENPRGDLEDLAQAAAYFDFSYTIIGVDAGGNFFWRDYVAQHQVDGENGPYLAFFVKTLADRTMFWYALEDVGRSCPKEKKLYKDVQAGDLSAWEGKFYFRYTPSNMNAIPINNPKSSKSILKGVPTQVIFRAGKWASKSYGRIRSSVKSSLSNAAFKTKSFVRSILDFIRWLTSRRRVLPDKKVEAIYVRENP